MFFQTTRQGQPLRKRRYFFSECFATMAYASYAKASGDREMASEARSLLDRCLEYYRNPGLLEPKFTDVRPAKSIGIPMILLNVVKQFRETIGLEEAKDLIDEFI